MNRGEAALRRRLQRARSEGDLPAEADPAQLARWVTTLKYGMAVQAAGGASRKELNRVVDLMLESWPSAPRPARSVARPRPRSRRGRGAG